MKSKFSKYFPLIIVLSTASEIYFTYLFLHLINTVLQVPYGTVYYKLGAFFLLSFLFGILLAVLVNIIALSKIKRTAKRILSCFISIIFQSIVFIAVFAFERQMREFMLSVLKIPYIELFSFSQSLKLISSLIILSFIIGLICFYSLYKIKNREIYKENHF